eukprot:1144119-Pelagomonas_calceolata.AAC.2
MFAEGICPIDSTMNLHAWGQRSILAVVHGICIGKKCLSACRLWHFACTLAAAPQAPPSFCRRKGMEKKHHPYRLRALRRPFCDPPYGYFVAALSMLHLQHLCSIPRMTIEGSVASHAEGLAKPTTQ